MTNAPETRKTHVIRILGTNKAGDVLPDISADVERIDAAKSVYQSDETSFQGTVRRLKWQDDPDQDDYNPDGPASRKMRVLKVCSPDEEDPSDPKEWIPISVIDEMRSVSGDQGAVRRFINDKPTDSRIVVQRRILHYDTSIDDQAQAAFDADPSRKVFVVPGDQYTRDDSTKDDSQYVEHEIITFLKGQVSDESGTGQGDDQGQQTKLLNQYLIDESEAAKLDVVGSDGFNPPWRLDPYQNIVNVKFKTLVPTDVYICGKGGANYGSHIRIGVRDGVPVIISTGTVFGASYQIAFSRSDVNLGLASPPSMYPTEELVLDDGATTGLAVIQPGSGFIPSGTDSFTNFSASDVLLDVKGKLTDGQFANLANRGIIQDSSKKNVFTVAVEAGAPYSDGAVTWTNLGAGGGNFANWTSNPFNNLTDFNIVVRDSDNNVVLTYFVGTDDQGSQILIGDPHGNAEVVGVYPPVKLVAPGGSLAMAASA